MLAFSLLLSQTCILHNDLTSGQTFENNMKHRETSQGMKIWSICMWPREELDTTERSGRNCRRKTRKSKKATELPNKGKLKQKKNIF